MSIRHLRLILWGMVAVALFGVGAVLATQWTMRGTPVATRGAGVPLGDEFQLVSHRGEPVSEAILHGKPSVLFFGFTHCPDVCPTALFEMSEWIAALGADAERLNYVFVTVDPERDTPEVLREYLSAFSDRITGVTGDPEKVAAMLSDYHIYNKKVPLEGGDYTMDHTASVFLLDENRALSGTVSREESRDAALAKLRNFVAS